MSTITGWSHAALTVTDLQRSVDWYGRVLGMAELFRFATDDFTRVLLGHRSGVVLALTEHRAGDDGGVAFDPSRTGLDHLSWSVTDDAALEAWCLRLDELDVRHDGVQRDPELGSALVAFTDPDGIQLEVYVQTGPPSGA